MKVHVKMFEARNGNKIEEAARTRSLQISTIDASRSAHPVH